MTEADGPDPRIPYKEHFDQGTNEILVVTSGAALVLATLESLGIAEPESDPSLLLGLTRLTFNADLQPGERITQLAADYIRRVGHGTLNTRDPIGLLLSALKEQIIVDGAGRIPTMGRNRLVGHVAGTDGGPIVSGEPPVVVPDDSRMPLGRFAALAALGATGPDIVPHGEVRVGMVDTELRHHPVLDGARVLPQPRPFLRRSNQIGDESSHSSDEALTFRASHATAIAGVVLQAAPGAEIDVQGTLVDQGWTTSWNAANAIASYAESGIDILNLSFSCYTRDGLPPLALTTAIDRLDPRIVVVAAAGNYGQYTSAYDLDLSKAPAWPAAIDSVIAVGAAEHGDDEKWRTAAFSPKAPWVDIVAQGTNVLSVIIARPEGPADGRNADALPEHPSFARWSGTSLATALVTGRIADWIVRHRVPAWVAWRQLAESLEVGLEDSVPDVYDPKILEP